MGFVTSCPTNLYNDHESLAGLICIRRLGISSTDQLSSLWTKAMISESVGISPSLPLCYSSRSTLQGHCKLRRKQKASRSHQHLSAELSGSFWNKQGLGMRSYPHKSFRPLSTIPCYSNYLNLVLGKVYKLPAATSIKTALQGKHHFQTSRFWNSATVIEKFWQQT